MAKWTNDSVYDAMLNAVGAATELRANTAQPSDRNTAISTSVIPAATPAFVGPRAGTPNGREIEVSASNGNTADAPGTVNHVSLTDATNLLVVTTCADEVVGIGDTVNISSWIGRITDPV